MLKRNMYVGCQYYGRHRVPFSYRHLTSKLSTSKEKDSYVSDENGIEVFCFGKIIYENGCTL